MADDSAYQFGLTLGAGEQMASREAVQICLCSGGKDDLTEQALGVQLQIDESDVELGQDIDVVTDLDPLFRLALGKRNLANAIARRLFTPGGFLHDSFRGDANYGFDIRGKLNQGMTLAELGAIEDKVEAEVMGDERVRDADVLASHELATSTLTVTIHLETAVGPHRLIIKINDLSVEVLELQ